MPCTIKVLFAGRRFTIPVLLVGPGNVNGEGGFTSAVAFGRLWPRTLWLQARQESSARSIYRGDGGDAQHASQVNLSGVASFVADVRRLRDQCYQVSAGLFVAALEKNTESKVSCQGLLNEFRVPKWSVKHTSCLGQSMQARGSHEFVRVAQLTLLPGFHFWQRQGVVREAWLTQ